jgi:hypothetical protein
LSKKIIDTEKINIEGEEVAINKGKKRVIKANIKQTVSKVK